MHALNVRFLGPLIHRGYYTVARRYEFYVRVARTILLFLPREHKIHIFSPTCNVLFITDGEANSTRAKAGNRDVIERYDTHQGDIRKIRHSGPG